MPAATKPFPADALIILRPAKHGGWQVGEERNGRIRELLTFPNKRMGKQLAQAFIRGMAAAEGNDPQGIRYFNYRQAEG